MSWHDFALYAAGSSSGALKIWPGVRNVEDEISSKLLCFCLPVPEFSEHENKRIVRLSNFDFCSVNLNARARIV